MRTRECSWCGEGPSEEFGPVYPEQGSNGIAWHEGCLASYEEEAERAYNRWQFSYTDFDGTTAVAEREATVEEECWNRIEDAYQEWLYETEDEDII